MPDNRQIKAFFDGLAEDWDKNDGHDYKKISRLLSQIGIKKGDKILDVACGTGVISQQLYARSKEQVVAIDLSKKMIDEAKKKNIDENKVLFMNVDFYEMSMNGFDVIVIFDAYPHFLDLNSLKDSLLYCLKDGGKVCIFHDLGRKMLHDHHKGRDVSLLSRDLKDPFTESEFYSKEFVTLKAIEDESTYFLLMEKRKSAIPMFEKKENVDKREIKSKENIISSFFELLKDQEYGEIRISDVILRDRISRSTFYSHYKSKNDIVEDYIHTIIHHVIEENGKESGHDYSSKRDYESIITHLLCHVKEEKDRIQLLYKKNRGLFEEIVIKELISLMSMLVSNGMFQKDAVEQEAFSIVLSYSFYSLTIDWMKKGFVTSENDLSDMFFRIYQ